MALPHFDNVTPTATDEHEPVYPNLFEITFNFPDILGLSDDDETIMMLNTTAINGHVTTPDLNTAIQRFKYSGRLFLMPPQAENSVVENLSINFEVNVDDAFAIKTWNYLKNWYDLAWNSQTGELHYKRDMTGTIVVHLHDREGVVIRRIEYRNVQIKGVNGGFEDLDWSAGDIARGSANFAADYWVDQYFNITNEN
jgi:hypothetical protein